MDTPPPCPETEKPFTVLRQIPANVWVLGLASMFMDISSEMIHSLLPLFMVGTLGAGAFVVGLVEGAAEATALIVKIFSGALSDYLGKRKALAVAGYGMSVLTKPLFAVAGGIGLVLTARLLDRVGKGVRGAPRDALVADATPARLRGASFGLRQAMDTAGAVFGPLLAAGLMLLWANDFRKVFWIAMLPGLLTLALLLFGVREPEAAPGPQRSNPISRTSLKKLGPAFWWVVTIGAIFSLARFSEAFLVLRAQQSGIAVAHVPLVMVTMNVVYAACAYPFGKLADRFSHSGILAVSLLVLAGADLALALGDHWSVALLGIALWGMHLGMTQGLMAAMVAGTAPADLRGTAFGMFNLASGLAVLAASVLAGLVWDAFGAPATFWAGGGFCLLALALLAGKPKQYAEPAG